jgi:hypothetical protein
MTAAASRGTWARARPPLLPLHVDWPSPALHRNAAATPRVLRPANPFAAERASAASSAVIPCASSTKRACQRAIARSNLCGSTSASSRQNANGQHERHANCAPVVVIELRSP